MPKSFGPMLEVARIQSEINRLFDNLVDLGPEGEPGSTWMPNADILETRDNLVVKIELPGVDPARLSLSITSGNLVVEGEKERQPIEGPAEFHAAEREFGRFRRVIHLGVPVNTRQARAELLHGLMRISFPKVPNRRGEAVSIKVESR